MAVRALDYALAVAFALGPRRLVSTPSPFGAWLGVASPLGQGVRRLCRDSHGRFRLPVLNSLSLLCLPISPPEHGQGDILPEEKKLGLLCR